MGRFDAHLTAEGWRQAEDLNSHIVSSGLQVDLVVVSPMMRALETAVGAFGRCVARGLCRCYTGVGYAGMAGTEIAHVVHCKKPSRCPWQARHTWSGHCCRWVV